MKRGKRIDLVRQISLLSFHSVLQLVNIHIMGRISMLVIFLGNRGMLITSVNH
jgi:hypothetical protein